MKSAKYWLQYLAVVSLLLMIISGAYDIFTGLKASAWYTKWYTEHYGPMDVSSVVFNYGLGLLRGTAALFGCGLWGLVQVRKKRVRTGYLLFLAFWASQYVLAIISKSYKGIETDDVVQALIAVFCLAVLAAHKVLANHPTHK